MLLSISMAWLELLLSAWRRFAALDVMAFAYEVLLSPEVPYSKTLRYKLQLPYSKKQI